MGRQWSAGIGSPGCDHRGSEKAGGSLVPGQKPS